MRKLFFLSLLLFLTITLSLMVAYLTGAFLLLGGTGTFAHESETSLLSDNKCAQRDTTDVGFLDADSFNLNDFIRHGNLDELLRLEQLLYFPRVQNISGTPPLYYNDYQILALSNESRRRNQTDEASDNSRITAITFEFEANYGGLVVLCPKIGFLFESLGIQQKPFLGTVEEYRKNEQLPPKCLVPITDKQFFKKMEFFLRNIRSCARIVPDNRNDIRGGTGSGIPSTYVGLNFGSIHVETTKGSFVILLSRPLSIRLRSSHIQYPFYSWGITQLIDDVVFQKTRRHLPNEIKEWWTGEADIREEKAKYEHINFR